MGPLGRGTTRAEDAQGTPTQSHISPSILVIMHNKRESAAHRFRAFYVKAVRLLQPDLPRGSAFQTGIGTIPVDYTSSLKSRRINFRSSFPFVCRGRRISSGPEFVIHTRAQWKSLHTWIISVIVKEHLVHVFEWMDLPSIYHTYSPRLDLCRAGSSRS